MLCQVSEMLILLILLEQETNQIKGNYFGISVTRSGEISPLWHNFQSLGQIFKGSFSIWQNFDPTLAKMLCYW